MALGYGKNFWTVSLILVDETRNPANAGLNVMFVLGRVWMCLDCYFGAGGGTTNKPESHTSKGCLVVNAQKYPQKYPQGAPARLPRCRRSGYQACLDSTSSFSDTPTESSPQKNFRTGHRKSMVHVEVIGMLVHTGKPGRGRKGGHVSLNILGIIAHFNKGIS